MRRILLPANFVLVFLASVASFSASVADAQLIQLGDFLEKSANGEIDQSRLPHSYFESKDQFLELLVEGMEVLGSGEERDRCLNILAHRYPQEARKLFEEIARDKERELEVRLSAIYWLALRRELDLLPFYESLLDSPETRLRIAGMGGISFYNEVFGTRDFGHVKLTENPDFWAGQARFNLHGEEAQRWRKKLAIGFTQALREKLHERMQNAETPQERQAASRAIVNWSADAPGLRAAEWGVWIGTANNKLDLVQSIVDEIPDFVFHTPNLVDDLQSTRVNQIMTIDKPVLHLTSETDLAVDVTVAINRGQISFSYPEPDDFFVATKQTGLDGTGGLTSIELMPFSAVLQSDSTSRFESFLPKDIGSPYHWIAGGGKFGDISGSMGTSGNAITGLGFSWFNLRVSPEQGPGWNAPELAADQFEWWSELRQVNSSWITNGKQTERFLYYDGPTIADSPVTVTQDSSKLSVVWPEATLDPGRTCDFGDPRQALLLQVKNGQFRSTYQFAESEMDFAADELDWLNEDKTLDALYRLLTSRGGLTNDEASGLVAAWKKQFLQTDGTRLLARVNRSAYDESCPITIRPRPGELSRVGLVLFELEEFSPGWKTQAQREGQPLAFKRTDRLAEDKLIRQDAKVRNLLRKWFEWSPDRIELLHQSPVGKDPEFRSMLIDYLVGSPSGVALLQRLDFFDEFRQATGNEGVLELVAAITKFRSKWVRKREQSRVAALLDFVSGLVKSGLQLPRETVQGLAVLIGTQETSSSSFAFHFLAREIEPRIVSLADDSIELQEVVAVLERLITGETDYNANDLDVKSRLLSPMAASRLLEMVLERTGYLADSAPIDDQGLSGPLLLGTRIASYVQPDDADRLKELAEQVQAKLSGRPRHLTKFCTEIKQKLAEINK